MHNPFKKEGYILPIASINSVYIGDHLVGDLFRLELINDDIIEHQQDLNIYKIDDKKSVFDGFQKALLSQDEGVSTCAKKIAHKYGKHLADMLVTLKKPSTLSIENRTNWSKTHWDYWKTVKKIIFVGGVSLPALTKVFMKDIKEALRREDISLDISFVEGSINLGTEALTKKLEFQDALFFDFGQTNIKRRHHIKEKNDVLLDLILPCISSQYLFYKNQSNDELYDAAVYLDHFILDVIIDTMNETVFEGDKLFIAMANYIYKGSIYPNRGGYGKLGLLEEQYQQHLVKELKKLTGKTFNVQLFHDTTAMSYFFEREEHTAIISIGTAFGVAFLDGE